MTDIVFEQAFVYKWTHLPTNRWYVGVRFKKGCHPDDGYICSSKIVKPMVEAHPEQWAREIIAIGASKKMRMLERDILVKADAKNNPMSFNRNNADGMPSGGRKSGSITKIPGSKIIEALERVCGKSFLQQLHENYTAVVKDGNTVLINKYQKMFDNKGIKYGH